MSKEPKIISVDTDAFGKAIILWKEIAMHLTSTEKAEIVIHYDPGKEKTIIKFSRDPQNEQLLQKAEELPDDALEREIAKAKARAKAMIAGKADVCGRCRHYIQHYSLEVGWPISVNRISEIWMGHCTKTRKRSVRPDQKVCEQYERNIEGDGA